MSYERPTEKEYRHAKAVVKASKKHRWMGFVNPDLVYESEQILKNRKKLKKML